jgi:hypothetical protein
MAYTLDTKLGDILNDPRAVEVLERYVPGVSKNPLLDLAKEQTLRSLLAMPQAEEYGVTGNGHQAAGRDQRSHVNPFCGECPKRWADHNFATHLPLRAGQGENTEFTGGKNARLSAGSVAEPTKLDTPVLCEDGE